MMGIKLYYLIDDKDLPASSGERNNYITVLIVQSYLRSIKLLLTL